jgi:CRISPR/Cas system Type II protein with McrA/HNH and RuvC-like nuclease domain|tara:strand:+ start:183 stop:719 length:537 start_codon:yes stop_codon:yes gene_type:complete
MKDRILELRKEGKTYNQIKEIIGCSKGTISYHCGNGQKEKTKKRKQKIRENVLLAKVERFKYRKRKNVVENIRKFQKRDNTINGDVNKNIDTNFDWEDVLKKFGEDTKCYLSGEEINLYDKTYQLDHIIASSKGGDNSLDNMGITHEVVNKMKGNLTPDELIEWCIKILKYNEYKITK